MIKKSLFIFCVASVFVVHAENLDETLCKEMSAEKYIAPREIVESAVEEAIQCLQQLQERLLQELVQQWAEGLLGYLHQLLKNKVTVQVTIDGADGLKKTIYSESI